MTKDMEELLSPYNESTFCPAATMARIHLRRAKSLKAAYRDEDYMTGFNAVPYECLLAAKTYERRLGKSPTEYLLALDRVGSHNCMQDGIEHELVPHWSSTIGGNQPLYLGAPMLAQEMSFLTFAINFELNLFVKEYLARNPSEAKRRTGCPLLIFALNRLLLSSLMPPSREIVEILLDAGADPNENARTETLPGCTVWESFLLRCAKKDCDQPSELVPIAYLLPNRGANVNARVNI